MALTFENLIQHNKRASIVLLASIVCFLSLLCGTAITVTSGAPPGLWIDIFATGCLIGLLLALLGTYVSWFYGDSVITSITSARKITHSEDPELSNITEEIAIAAGLPTPAIYLIDDPSPNAFATGRDPEHALIAVTSGLREKLSRDELQAVVAHETAHIRNYDIRLMMLVSVFAGMIVLISDLLSRTLRGGLRSHRSSSGKGSAGVALVVALAAVIAVLLAWLSPLIARLLQLAVSREREYLADATAVKLNRNPQALISALSKIARDPVELHASSRAVEHLFIVNPSPRLRLQRADLDSVWATHPPLIKRIARLRQLTQAAPG